MSEARPPLWFKIVVGLCFAWNVLGVLAYIGQATMTEEALQALPEAQAAFYADYPAWATSGFAIGVFGGCLGCILLFLRKGAALSVLVVSLLGVLVQSSYAYILADGIAIFGPAGIGFSVLVWGVGVYEIWLAHSASSKDWWAS